MWTSSPITSRHSRAAASSWSLRTVENTQEMATERTLPRSPSKKARAASWSKGANSLPSYSKPPPTMTLSTAIFFRSSAQSTMGGMPTVAGAPMRMTPMGARFLRSTMALVHWVVPSMAWPMALGVHAGLADDAPHGVHDAVVYVGSGVALDLSHHVEIFIDQHRVGIGAAYVNAQLVHQSFPPLQRSSRGM